jgi:SAM-dependent methyltransferase
MSGPAVANFFSQEVAYHWHELGPPLRPCAADLAFMQSALARWAPRGGPLQAVLCGVTPEIAGMSWPPQTQLLAVDRSPPMIEVVWPGDIPGRRKAVLGNWLERLPIEPHSQDVVIGDGCFLHQAYPAGQDRFAQVIQEVLRADGLLIMRYFVQAVRREDPAEVLAALRAGNIGSFHAFKWRLAMALQEDPCAGVRIVDVWNAWQAAGIDRGELLERTGWRAEAVATIDLYQGQQGRFTYPTLEQYRRLLAPRFQELALEIPAYELGDRCPILVGRPK